MKTQLTPFENYYVICLYFFVVVGIKFGQNIFLLFIIFCSYVWLFCLILIMNTCFNMMLFAATSISLVVHDCVCWFFRCAYILCLFVVFRIFQTELINICSPVNFDLETIEVSILMWCGNFIFFGRSMPFHPNFEKKFPRVAPWMQATFANFAPRTAINSINPN